MPEPQDAHVPDAAPTEGAPAPEVDVAELKTAAGRMQAENAKLKQIAEDALAQNKLLTERVDKLLAKAEDAEKAKSDAESMAEQAKADAAMKAAEESDVLAQAYGKRFESLDGQIKALTGELEAEKAAKRARALADAKAAALKAAGAPDDALAPLIAGETPEEIEASVAALKARASFAPLFIAPAPNPMPVSSPGGAPANKAPAAPARSLADYMNEAKAKLPPTAGPDAVSRAITEATVRFARDNPEAGSH